MLEGRFGDMAELLAGHGLRRLDGVVLDLGVSSMQLDDAGRGFSFAVDGPLDMRMSGPAQCRRGGQLRRSRHARRHLAALRRGARGPAHRQGDRPAAAAAADQAHARAGRAGRRRGRRPRPAASIRRPAPFRRCAFTSMTSSASSSARCPAAEALLAPGGRLVVVAFHSLEDRIVKRFLAERSGAAPRPSRHLPLEAATGGGARWRLLAKRAVRPGPAEIAANPRARSARLRWAERAARRSRRHERQARAGWPGRWRCSRRAVCTS